MAPSPWSSRRSLVAVPRESLPRARRRRHALRAVTRLEALDISGPRTVGEAFLGAQVAVSGSRALGGGIFWGRALAGRISRSALPQRQLPTRTTAPNRFAEIVDRLTLWEDIRRFFADLPPPDVWAHLSEVGAECDGTLRLVLSSPRPAGNLRKAFRLQAPSSLEVGISPFGRPSLRVPGQARSKETIDLNFSVGEHSDEDLL